MRKGFFPKLALQNIKNNRKTYFPYILTCIGTIMMFYIMMFIASNEGLMNMPGSGTVSSMMGFGSVVIAIFSAVFLFYTNSFLIKRRKKEIGLYNILGMAKRHILIVLFFETLFTGLFSLIIGIAAGILGSKLMLLVLIKILHFNAPFGFTISTFSIIAVVILFGVIFFVTLLFNLCQIHVAKPIELLKGGQTGEKEPKTRWILAIIGFISLAAGYIIALTVESPIDALGFFFIAVILVMIGTYCLFTAGSIAVLKILRKNKRFYYKTKHFTSVSGMIYRMKQNAVGLANICILSTAVLVTLSTTVSLYIGTEDILRARYPYEISVINHEATEETIAIVDNAVKNALETSGIPLERQISYRFRDFIAAQAGTSFTPGNTMSPQDSACLFYLMPLEDYNRTVGANFTLEEDELLLHVDRGEYRDLEMNLFGQNFRIKEQLEDYPIDGASSAMMVKSCYVVVKDMGVIESLIQSYSSQIEDIYGDLTYYIGLDTGLSAEESISLYEQVDAELDKTGINTYSECREASRDDLYALYGGFFFLGISLGALFLMATVLIIYYKQISEGFEDQARFEIMQKVGMTQKEIKKTIHSQILMVFFLPLLMAIIHIAFAFNMISKLLSMFNLVNVPLFALCTLGTILIFAVLYAIVYSLTARAYYKIVK